jgi:hypothetical protein
MFSSVALDVVIGLIFIYVLYSLLASTINELIATMFDFRSKTLEKAIKRMLDDGGLPILKDEFYKSPLIKYLGDFKKKWLFFGKKNDKKPSYLLSRNFSDALVYILQKKGEEIKTDQNKNVVISQQPPLITLAAGLESFKGTKLSKDLKASDTIEYIEHLLNNSEASLEKFKSKLEAWFDDTMERATGWYKRKTQLWIFIIGLFLSVIFNADTIKIIDVLSKDDKIRAQMAELAVNSVNGKNAPKTAEPISAAKPKDNKDSINSKKAAAGDSTKKDSTLLRIKANLTNVDSAYSGVTKANTVMGLGWDGKDFKLNNSSGWLSILGWLITALAISLGAPFWFDLLSKIVNIRGASKSSGSTAGDSKINKKV